MISHEREITVYLEPDSPPDIDQNQNIKEPLIQSIVSPSDLPESEEIPLTNKLSDKTTKVEKEQIKRGDAPSERLADSGAGQQKIKNLFLNENTPLLASNAYEEVHKKNNDAPNEMKESSADRIQNFVGMSAGNSDYLPNIPDGDLTMLNAKADRFAVFVRRVALQVFSALRTSDWTDHPVFQKSVTTDEVTIRAIMDKNGKLISAHIIQPSSHPSFDSIVLRSVKKGTWDKNPPHAALAEDGNIRFIFKSKAWVRNINAVNSRKWILLGTGLE